MHKLLDQLPDRQRLPIVHIKLQRLSVEETTIFMLLIRRRVFSHDARVSLCIGLIRSCRPDCCRGGHKCRFSAIVMILMDEDVLTEPDPGDSAKAYKRCTGRAETDDAFENVSNHGDMRTQLAVGTHVQVSTARGPTAGFHVNLCRIGMRSGAVGLQ